MIEKSSELTEEQREIITGNLLGDGSISFIKTNNSNCQFYISQSLEKSEYIDFLHKIYSPFSLKCNNAKTKKPSKVDGKICHENKYWNGDYCYRYGLRTVHHPIFKNLRFEWYKFPYGKRSPKIIPQNLKLTWKIAAFWACDDGSNAIKYSRCFALHTECFTENEVEFLIDRLRKDLDVCGKLINRSGSGQPIICFYGDEHDKFVLGIRPFIECKCFANKYTRKLPTQKRTVNKNSSGMWVAKITINKTSIWLGAFKNKNDAENILQTSQSMKKLGIKDENEYIALRPALQSNNTTGLRGLYYQNKWLAKIRVNGINLHLGSFGEKEHAVKTLEVANKMKIDGIIDVKSYIALRPVRATKYKQKSLAK